MFYIFTHVMSRATHSDPGLPMVSSRKYPQPELINVSLLWRYIPAKIQTLICNIVVWHYCSFSHSNIQLLLFNIVHSLFNVHISNATWLRCKMRYAPNAIQHPCFLHSQSMPLFCFQISSFNMQHSCLSMQF